MYGDVNELLKYDRMEEAKEGRWKKRSTDKQEATEGAVKKKDSIRSKGVTALGVSNISRRETNGRDDERVRGRERMIWKEEPIERGAAWRSDASLV